MVQLMLARLTDGTAVAIRPIRPSDKRLLEKGFARLSAETVRKRFLAPKPSLTPRELVYLTEVDGDHHVALVAVLADRPDRLVAVGRFIRLADDPSTADVAIVVADELQGMGLGRRLSELLANEAQRVGVERFSATMLADNVAAHRLFNGMSDRLVTERQRGVDELTIPLAA